MKKWIISFLSLFIIFSTLSITNTTYAASVSIGVSTQYGPGVRWVPGHWSNGYWIPGHYVERGSVSPRRGYVWYPGYYSRGRWHHGYWGPRRRDWRDDNWYREHYYWRYRD